MTKLFRVFTVVFATLFLSFALAACEEQGTAEKAGEAIDDAAEKAAETVEEGAKQAEQIAEEGAEKVEEAAEEVKKSAE
jgi:hyperosmotically inducible protein